MASRFLMKVPLLCCGVVGCTGTIAANGDSRRELAASALERPFRVVRQPALLCIGGQGRVSGARKRWA